MCPLDWPQVFAWFLTGSICILFFCVNFAMEDEQNRKFWTPLFIIPYISGILLFVRATLSTHLTREIASPDYGHFCRYCKLVVPNEAKHCRRCNKCRVGFDHHCRYINNCVTKSNYFAFFFGCLFLVSSTVIGIVELVINTISYCGEQREVILERISSFYGASVGSVGFWAMFGSAMLFNVGVLAPMLVLVAYHVFFQSAGITTYDYIMDDVSSFPQKLQRLTCSSDRIKRA